MHTDDIRGVLCSSTYLAKDIRPVRYLAEARLSLDASEITSTSPLQASARPCRWLSKSSRPTTFPTALLSLHTCSPLRLQCFDLLPAATFQAVRASEMTSTSATLASARLCRWLCRVSKPVASPAMLLGFRSYPKPCLCCLPSTPYVDRDSR